MSVRLGISPIGWSNDDLPAKAPPLVYARRGFAYLSAALRDMEW
jgi:hypothetical protein